LSGRGLKTNEKVLVLGADGLLGSHLVRRLLERGFGVRVFLQPQRRSPTLDNLDLGRRTGDLSGNAKDLVEAVKGCAYVFHLAAITDLWADADAVWKVNFDGTLRVLDACLAAGVRRLVFVGSASSFQFGTLQNPGDEHGVFPKAYQGIPYMESKHRAAELVRQYVRERNLDAVIVAPTFMLGDLDANPSSGELIRQFIKRKLRFTSAGGRNFAHASDVAAAIVAALDQGRRGETYLAGGQNMTYFDFFTRVARLAGTHPPVAALPGGAVLAFGTIGSVLGKITGKRPPIDARMARLSLLGTYYRSDKAIAELAMPQTPIEVGIADTIRGLKSFGHI